MLSPHHLLLLVTLLADGGTVPIPPSTTSPDAGTAALPSSLKAPDAGTAAPKPGTSSAVPWPEEEFAPLATLDGPAILAAHAALQQVMKRFPKEYTRQCAFSPKALELIIGYQAGWYFIRVNHHVDKCPEFGPGFTAEFDWFELYAYSPDGRLERYPYMP
jgi:hypothetical protein